MFRVQNFSFILHGLGSLSQSLHFQSLRSLQECWKLILREII